jgi:hypothetical protein
MKTQNQITLIGALIVASIISTPIIYAAVEPHIILTMDASQTTNPFTINNNTDYTMFEIDDEGFVNSKLEVNHRTGNTPYVITAADDLADPIILAEWVLDRSVIAADDPFHIPVDGIVMTMHVKRDSGAGNCIAAFAQHDGAAWSLSVSIGSTSASYVSSTDNDGEGVLFDDTEKFAWILYNSDSATTCSFKNLAAIGEMTLPESITYTRGV